ncbi:MAG: hypothetical protein NVV68_16860 [Dokdonella sp.]|nr:hypothetical protein [Dokdonella sp.]
MLWLTARALHPQPVVHGQRAAVHPALLGIGCPCRALFDHRVGDDCLVGADAAAVCAVHGVDQAAADATLEQFEPARAEDAAAAQRIAGTLADDRAAADGQAADRQRPRPLMSENAIQPAGVERQPIGARSYHGQIVHADRQRAAAQHDGVAVQRAQIDGVGIAGRCERRPQAAGTVVAAVRDRRRRAGRCRRSSGPRCLCGGRRGRQHAGECREERAARRRAVR